MTHIITRTHARTTHACTHTHTHASIRTLSSARLCISYQDMNLFNGSSHLICLIFGRKLHEKPGCLKGCSTGESMLVAFSWFSCTGSGEGGGFGGGGASVTFGWTDPVGIFTRGQFWPSGIVVACVCVCVCLSVCLCVSITCLSTR